VVFGITVRVTDVLSPTARGSIVQVIVPGIKNGPQLSDELTRSLLGSSMSRRFVGSETSGPMFVTVMVYSRG